MVKIYLDEKRIRAEVIKRYLGSERCFAFSCGNATRALKEAGVNVVGISPHDLLSANGYINPLKAKEMFACFDATSGHLPLFLMELIAYEIKNHLIENTDVFQDKELIYVPTGSGETILALSYYIPIARLVAVVDYEDEKSPTFFSPAYTPLYCLLTKNFEIIDKSKLPEIHSGYVITKGRKSLTQ